MKQAIPRSLNFGENHRGLSPERISMQFSKAGQLAMAGWAEERTSLGDAGFIAKTAQDARRGRHPVTTARQRSETNQSEQRSLKTRLAITEKIQTCAGTHFWRIIRMPFFTHPQKQHQQRAAHLVDNTTTLFLIATGIRWQPKLHHLCSIVESSQSDAEHSSLLLSDLPGTGPCFCCCCFIHCLQRKLKAWNEAPAKPLKKSRLQTCSRSDSCFLFRVNETSDFWWVIRTSLLFCHQTFLTITKSKIFIKYV